MHLWTITKVRDEADVGCNVSAATAGSDASSDATASLSGVIQKAKDIEERPSEVCVGSGKRDDCIVYTL